MPNLVEPLGAAPAAAPVVEPLTEAPPPPAAPDEGQLTDELLQIPALQALMAGQPAAVSTIIKEFSNRPEAAVIVPNKDALAGAGINFYRAMDGKTGVIFNQLYVSGKDIQAADKAGKLQELAPPFDDVNAAVMQAGPDNPVLTASGVPGGPGEGEAPQPPQSGSPIPPGGGLSAGSEQKITAARLKSMAPSSPSSGAKPGQGRLLNKILQQPV